LGGDSGSHQHGGRAVKAVMGGTGRIDKHNIGTTQLTICQHR
jgi:hypothetical protein